MIFVYVYVACPCVLSVLYVVVTLCRPAGGVFGSGLKTDLIFWAVACKGINQGQNTMQGS